MKPPSSSSEESETGRRRRARTPPCLPPPPDGGNSSGCCCCDDDGLLLCGAAQRHRYRQAQVPLLSVLGGGPFVPISRRESEVDLLLPPEQQLRPQPKTKTAATSTTTSVPSTKIADGRLEIAAADDDGRSESVGAAPSAAKKTKSTGSLPSASIPIVRPSGLRRTFSEEDLVDGRREFEYRDNVVYHRIVGGMSSRLGELAGYRARRISDACLASVVGTRNMTDEQLDELCRRRSAADYHDDGAATGACPVPDAAVPDNSSYGDDGRVFLRHRHEYSFPPTALPAMPVGTRRQQQEVLPVQQQQFTSQQQERLQCEQVRLLLAESMQEVQEDPLCFDLEL